MTLGSGTLDSGWIEAFTCDLLPGRIVFGAGALDRIREETEALRCSRVLVIAGGSAAQVGERTVALLQDLVAGTFHEVRQHVPEELAARAVDAARAAAADGVVTVGGGSTIGLGKVVAATANVPLIAVPTTYSGSEMTPTYGVTGERKVTRRDPRALPKTVIYDPELTLGLPGRVTASSGLNALAHCMEAIVGPGANPPAALAAREASAILPGALRSCVREPRAEEARSDAQYGGFLAARSLALAGTGLQHTLAHILGGRFKLVHADAHAVLLPHVAALHEREAPAPMSRFAESLGADGSASEALHRLAADTGAPLSLAELDMPREGIDVVVEDIAGIADQDVIRALLETAFEPMMPTITTTTTKGGPS
ncbi:MAG: maleylacetate reductase [Candidatus Eisenbacteria bacterium]